MPYVPHTCLYSFSSKYLKNLLRECFVWPKVILKVSLFSSSKVMTLERSTSRLNLIIGGWAFEINMENVSCLNMSGKSSQIFHKAPHKCINLCVQEEILRRRNLKVHSMNYSLCEIWEETKMRGLMRALKVSTLWNHWPKCSYQ